MRKIGVLHGLCLVVLVLLLAGCSGYTESGSQTTSHQGADGGDVTVSIGKANGTGEQSIELEGGADLTLEADVTLAVGKGSYKIELLGKGNQVTLTLEASDGQTVEGHGQLVTDSFGEAHYRVSATSAENVDYVIQYTGQ